MENTYPASTDKGSPTLEIYRRFRGLIVSGQLGANERLPTVRQTASDFGVAPGTAAKAYKLLEQEGLVVTRTAAGTRVSEAAATLPHLVIRPIRELVAAAESSGAHLNDVIDVLRVTWQTYIGVDESTLPGEDDPRASDSNGFTHQPSLPVPPDR